MSDTPPILTANETAEKIKAPGVTYVDVRTPEEFKEAHAPGAVNVAVALAGAAGQQQRRQRLWRRPRTESKAHNHDALEPNQDFVKQVEAALPDKKAEVILACGAGRRAARAAALLADAGYENLRLFKEGFTGWKAAGLPVEKGE